MIYRLQQPYGIIATFGLAGISSVLLLSVGFHVRPLRELIPFSLVGSVFGLCIAACFWIFGALRSGWKTALFIASCTVAFHLSLSSTMLAYNHFHIAVQTTANQRP